MTQYIADHRRMCRHQRVLPPQAAVLVPLETVGYTSARFGYTGKVFEITSLTDGLATLHQAVSLRERDGGDFAWTASDYIATSTAATVTTPPDAQDVPGWTVTAEVILDAAANARRPAVRLSWDGDAADDATGLQWEIRLAGAFGAQLTGTHAAVGTGTLLVSAGIIPGTAYEARGQFIVDRATLWSDWQAVTADAVLLGGVDIADDAIGTTKLATILQSDSYSPGVDGWQIKRDGNAEFNGVVLSRQIEVDTGYFTLPALIDDTNATTKHLVGSYWIETTIDSSAWTGVRETYLALVGKRAGSGYGTVFATSGNIASYPSLIQWGWGGEVVPITRWSGSPRLWIRAELWTQRVDRLEDFVLEWRLMKVT